MGVFFKSIIFVVLYPFWVVLSLIALIAVMISETLEWCNSTWKPWLDIDFSEEKEIKKEKEVEEC